MRVNIYAEEMTDRVEVISKKVDGHTYTGLRIYLELPVTLPASDSEGQPLQARGPFIHRAGDDDSSAVTFWGKQDLRKVLKLALEKLEDHYSAQYFERVMGDSLEDLLKSRLDPKDAFPHAPEVKANASNKT